MLFSNGMNMDIIKKLAGLPFFKKLVYYLERLSSKPIVGGMQISNSSIQYVFFEKGAKPKTFSLRLPPGVMKEGRIQNSNQFLNSLEQLHKLIIPERPTQVLQVAISLPASVVYTQSFTVPNIDEEKLYESALLNLRMISPLPADSAYMSWQIISKTPERYELLGAFVDRGIIDDLRRILNAARFYPVIFESPALSISHLLQKFIEPRDKSVLVLQVSSDGINLSIFRKNILHFDYFHSWQSIQGENRQISRSMFDQAVVDETQKVIRFTMSRFKESLEQVFLIAPGFEKEMQELLQTRFQLATTSLFFSPQTFPPALYVAWGTAVHGGVDLSKDQCINLNSETSADLYYEEHVIGFVRLWRNAFTIILGFFLVMFAGTTYFLNNQLADLRGMLVVSRAQFDEKEFAELRDKTTEFNDLVKGIRNEPRLAGFWYDVLSRFRTIAYENRVILNKIDISSIDSPLQVSARAPDSAAAIMFRNAMSKDPMFKDVDLPILGILELDDKSVSFSMKFGVVQGASR